MMVARGICLGFYRIYVNSVNLFFFFLQNKTVSLFEELKIYIYIDPYWGETFRKTRKMSTALRHLFPIFSYSCKQLTKIRINNDGHVIGFLFK